MTRRQKKKIEKRIQDSIGSGFMHFASYREMRKEDRWLHEYFVRAKHHYKEEDYGHDFDFEEEENL